MQQVDRYFSETNALSLFGVGGGNLDWERPASHVVEPQFQSVTTHSAFGHYAEGFQPASAHNSPLTAELEIRKQIALAISSGRISRRNWV